MRTDIFREFADLSEKFTTDFQILWKLPNEMRMKMISHVVEIFNAGTSLDREVLLDRAVAELGGNATEVMRVLKLLQFIQTEWNPVKDTAENFLKDLSDLNLLPTDRVEEANIFLAEFVASIEKGNKERLERVFSTGLIPCLTQCVSLIDFRAIIKNPFGTEISNKIDEYDPTCIGFVPVVLIKLRRGSQEQDSFIFQCEENTLKNFIEQLQGALKDLIAAKRSMPPGDQYNK
jgi:hypothetical protein